MSDKLAIDGGPPLRSHPYPEWPQWGEDERANLLDTLQSGAWWSQEGDQVTALEREFAAAHDARYGVGVTNGSAALEVCLRAAGIDWGDEIITAPYTFIATANACLLVGAIPRFADLLPDTWNLDPGQIEALITPRTKAIIPVHIAGEPADMDAILAIAREHDLIVVEDACQAHGATWQGRKVGALGDMGCFSFQASKNITGGEGGMILTNDESWADRCWSVANVGRERGGAWYHHIGLASNYRLVEWSAAILRAQLGRLEEHADLRARNGAYLAEALSEIDGLGPTRADPRVTRNAYHLFKIWYQPEAFGGRSHRDFAEAIQAEGIPISAGYPLPLSRQAMVVERIARVREMLGMVLTQPENCPVCEDVCSRGLWLRQSALLGAATDMEDVVKAALKIQRQWQTGRQ